MSEQTTNYDDVKQYKLDPEREEELRNTGAECTFIWANKAGHPLGVTSAYVRQRLAIKRASFKMGRFSISGELIGGGGRKRSANLIAFVGKTQVATGGGRRRKDGTRAQLTFQVRKAGGKKTITGAFIGNKGRTVFIRTGNARLPIKPVQTIDVADMFNQRRINARVIGAIRERFPVIFAREAKFALSKFNAGR